MSTVVLHSIQWSNCFSFGPDNYIDLDSATVTQIIGPNGYGKSSIPLILEEALYNKNSKGVKKAEIPNRVLNEPYSIELEFSIDKSNLYKVRITRSSNSVKVYLEENDLDISEHTATATFKKIEELMGMDFKVFQQLVYQSTNSSLRFLSDTDTNRKKFLISLFDLSRYTELFESFKSAISDLTAETSKLQGKVSTIQGWLDKNNSIDLTKKELVNVPERQDFSDELAQLKSKIAGAVDLNGKITSNNNKISQLDSIDIEDIKRKISDKISEYEELSYEDKLEQLGDSIGNRKQAKILLDKVEELKGQCPTCLQEVDQEFKNKLIEENSAKITEYDLVIDKLKKDIDEAKKNNAVLRSIEAEMAKYSILESQIDRTLPTDTIIISEEEEKLNKIKKAQDDINQAISKAEKLNADIEKHNHTVEIYTEQFESNSKELKEVKEELDTLQRKLTKLEILRDAFGTNGLVAYKLESLVKDLEDYTNKYLEELSDGRFSIGFTIVKDKLNVVVTDNGIDIDISAPSSGELARINIATLLGIRRLMSSISKNTINVLFLDEVISVLDDLGREKLVEVLLEEVGLNTFLVSHSWTHPLVDKLEVVKENDVSRIDHG